MSLDIKSNIHCICMQGVTRRLDKCNKFCSAFERESLEPSARILSRLFFVSDASPFFLSITRITAAFHSSGMMFVFHAV